MFNLCDISSNKVLHNRFVLLLFLSGQRDLVLEWFYSDESFDYSDDDDGTVIMMTMMKPIDERLVFKRVRCFVPDGGTDIGAWGVLSRHQIWR